MTLVLAQTRTLQDQQPAVMTRDLAKSIGLVTRQWIPTNIPPSRWCRGGQMVEFPNGEVLPCCYEINLVKPGWSDFALNVSHAIEYP